MMRFIVLTFAFLGFAWYEMSGGADFAAGDNTVASLSGVDFFSESEPLIVLAKAEPEAEPEVARADTVSLNTASVVPAPKIDLTLAAMSGPGRKSGPEAAGAKVVNVAASAAPAADPVKIAAPEPADLDLRRVTGNRVNLRGGPGTEFSVLGQLVRGDRVEVLADSGDGWVKLKSQRAEQVGWMSDSFLRVVVN